MNWMLFEQQASTYTQAHSKHTHTHLRIHPTSINVVGEINGVDWPFYRRWRIAFCTAEIVLNSPKWGIFSLTTEKKLSINWSHEWTIRLNRTTIDDQWSMCRKYFIVDSNRKCIKSKVCHASDLVASHLFIFMKWNFTS